MNLFPPCQGFRSLGRLLASAVVLLGAATAFNAQAVPSFARQTGQNCVACHAGGNFPELTPYGRNFKLTGYTIGTRGLPLAVMGVVSVNKTKNTNSADSGVDSRAAFPKDSNLIAQTGSVFLAGKVTDNIGGFVQVTYNNYDSQNANTGRWKGHTGSDNLDVRYADRFIEPGKDLIVGVSLNNNPTLQDVWNSTPAFGYNVVPGSSGPATTPLLAGGLAQNVAGVGAYAFWNQTLYAELSGYRTANGVFSFMSQSFNTNLGNQQILKGINPYWRLALSHEWGPHNAMIGTFGMVADVYDDPTDPSGTTTHRYRDIGIDAQYQYLLDPHTVTAAMSYIREKHTYPGIVANQAVASGLLDVDGNPQNNNNVDTLNMFRAKVSYVYRAKYGTALSFFNVTGSANPMNQTSGYVDNAGTYVNAGLGNASGNPATRGWTTELFVTPVQYARVGIQYTNYSKFNGASSNYDGFGRNPSDNNTLFAYVWGAY